MIKAPWDRGSPSSAPPAPHRMLHERRFFFLSSKAIVFTLSCVYGRSLFTGYLTNVINTTPLAVPAAARMPGPSPVGADLVPTRPLSPRGCPEAVHSRPLAPGTHRPFWAARDRSGRGLHRPASRESVRGLPDPLCRRRPRRNAHTPLRASLRNALIGCHLWRSWWRISRSAPTRRDGSNLITGVCSISP